MNNLPLWAEISQYLPILLLLGLLLVLEAFILAHELRIKWEKTQKELERVKEEFTAMMVHELRAPLTVVNGTTAMLLSHPEIAAQEMGLKLLNSMKSSAHAMLSLVNDLLDVAKIEAGKFQILSTKNKIGELISDRQIFFTELAKEKNITIKTAVQENLPEINFDRERLLQVFNNLLSNAIKFTGNSGTITIKSVLQEDSKTILCSITDTGAGIPKEQLPLLFSKFKQLKSSTKGTGLGLVIAKGIVEAHKGKIWAESTVNVGTTFNFTLPLV